MKYKVYIIQPSEYGFAQIIPLYIANIVNTKLEQWFQNNKFIHYAISNVKSSDFEKYNLPLEFTYSLRTQEIRNCDATRNEVVLLTNAKQYQLLVNIIIEALMMIYECKLIIETKKQGTSIIDFEKYISNELDKFGKQQYTN